MKKREIILEKKELFFTLFIMTVFTAYAAAGEWKEVRSRKLKKMMKEGDVLVVYTMSKIEYNDLHIKGSVNIPLHELKAKLPKDKNKKIVFYCYGRR